MKAVILAGGLGTRIAEETHRGMNTLNYYTAFQSEANAVKEDLLAFLLEQNRLGKTVAGYGAAAKGNTLLNYAGIKKDLLQFVVDAAESKQGKHLPGSHIPILAPQRLYDQCPDVVLILPWNIKDEVITQLAQLCNDSTRFITAVPQLQYFE